MGINRTNEEIAKQVVENCEYYIEKVSLIPDLNHVQLKYLVYHIVVGVLKEMENKGGS